MRSSPLFPSSVAFHLGFDNCGSMTRFAFLRVMWGAGLGLSLAKQIAENHGGKVGIESGPSGTKLSIQL